MLKLLNLGLVMIQYRSNNSSSDPGIGPIVFLIFVGLCLVALAIFTVGAIIYSARKRSDRAARLQALAWQIGFSFIPTPGVPDFLQHTRFAQWSPAVATGIHNLLSGTVNGRTMFIFDFGYTKTMAGFGSATYRETVVCIPRASAEPFLFLRDKTLVPPEQLRAFINAALQALQQSSVHAA